MWAEKENSPTSHRTDHIKAERTRLETIPFLFPNSSIRYFAPSLRRSIWWNEDRQLLPTAFNEAGLPTQWAVEGMLGGTENGLYNSVDLSLVKPTHPRLSHSQSCGFVSDVIIW